MVFRKKKIVIFNFLPYEYKSLQEYLEKMAAKGWVLENIAGYCLKFNKSQPKRLKYSVDIMDKISFLDGKNSEESLEYREYCKKAGWDFVCESEKIQIYCSEQSDERIDIQTDEFEKFNIISKASLKYVCLNLITLVSLLFTQYITTIGNTNANFLASTLRLNTLIFVTIFSIKEIVGIISFLMFFINGKKSLNKGGKVNYNFKKVVLIRRVLNYIGLIYIPIFFLSLAIQEDMDMVKLFIIMIILIFTFNYIINFIRDKNYKNKKIILSVTYVILTILILMIILYNISDSILKDLENNDSRQEEMLKQDFYLKLEDFNDKAIKDSSLYYRSSKSKIASHLYYYNIGENIHLSYEIFESKYKWAVEYNFTKKMKFFNENNIKYTEKETNLPKDIKVYMNEHNNEYTIVSENKMVEIYSIEGVSEEELINIVYNKVFNEK